MVTAGAAVSYRPKNPSYYRARAIDCENAANDETTAQEERETLLHAASQWRRLANSYLPRNPREATPDQRTPASACSRGAVRRGDQSPPGGEG